MNQLKPNKKPIRTVMLDIIFEAAGALLIGSGIYCFITGSDIALGGVSGVALIINYIWDLPIGAICFVINIPLFFLAYRYIGKNFTFRTFRTLLMFTILIDYVVAPFFPSYGGDRMISAIYGGLFIGGGLALIFLRGTTTGGTDIISYLIERKFPHIPLGQAIMIIDCIIISASMLIFKNLESGLFGVLSLFVQTKVIDSVLYGMEKGKTCTIMSVNNDTIADGIINELKRSATFLHSKGAYKGEDNMVLLCVVRPQEFHKLKKLVYRIDPNAFMIVGEANQILGEGFKDHIN